jgi:hypothetical protein
MNWKKIQQAWEAGDKQIAVRLLESMLYELRLRQRSLLDFQVETILKEEEVGKCQNGACLAEKQRCQT